MQQCTLWIVKSFEELDLCLEAEPVPGRAHRGRAGICLSAGAVAFSALENPWSRLAYQKSPEMQRTGVAGVFCAQGVINPARAEVQVSGLVSHSKDSPFSCLLEL